MAEIRYTIPLEGRTKKNHMKIVSFGRRCPQCGKRERQGIKQAETHDEFAAAAELYIRPRPPRPIECPVNVKCLFYMKTRRVVDGLNLQAAIDDLLVSCGVLKDDNSRIVAGHDGSRVLYDKDRPRVEIIITKMPDENPEQIKMEDH